MIFKKFESTVLSSGRSKFGFFRKYLQWRIVGKLYSAIQFTKSELSDFWHSHIQGWEFAQRFLKQFARFLWAKDQFACKKEQIAAVTLLLWETRANPLRSLFYHVQLERIAHGRSFVQSDGNESLKLLFKKSEWAKRDVSDPLLGIKKGNNCSKTYKNTNFLSESRVFCEQFVWITIESFHIALPTMLNCLAESQS